MTLGKQLLLAASTLAMGSMILTGAAVAADAIRPAVIPLVPQRAATPNWTGFYAGFGIGAEINKSTADFIFLPADVDASHRFTPTNFAGSVDGGYDFQAGRMVFGATANFDFASSDGSEIWAKDPDGHQRMTSDIRSLWGIGGRLGELVTDTTLLYGAAGYAGASAHLTAFDDAAPQNAYAGNRTLSGYYLGVGVETMINKGWSLTTEYRFNKLSGGFVTPPFDDPQGAVISFHDFSVQTIKVSLNHRF